MEVSKDDCLISTLSHSSTVACPPNDSVAVEHHGYLGPLAQHWSRWPLSPTELFTLSLSGANLNPVINTPLVRSSLLNVHIEKFQQDVFPRAGLDCCFLKYPRSYWSQGERLLRRVT